LVCTLPLHLVQKIKSASKDAQVRKDSQYKNPLDVKYAPRGFYIFSRFAHTKNMESQKMQALRLSLEIGAAMMESGGEVRRTEDTVTRINYAAGATDAQVWAVPGILTATVILADNTTHTCTKRLEPEEIDLAELDRLNTLSRRLCRGETVDWTVTKRRIYSRRTRLLCTFLATAAFCIYFGGTWAEAVLCGGFGILVSGYRPALQSGFTAVLLDATVAGLLAFTPQALGLPLRGANILIGTIMLLVPGLTVGNALRDMIDGDLLAGLLQLAEAVLCALAIALGCAFALWLPGSVER
jgi:uncharacterized membrane protein YjjP (DUF1212 family)